MYRGSIPGLGTLRYRRDFASHNIKNSRSICSTAQKIDDLAMKATAGTKIMRETPVRIGSRDFY